MLLCQPQILSRVTCAMHRKLELGWRCSRSQGSWVSLKPVSLTVKGERNISIGTK